MTDLRCRDCAHVIRRSDMVEMCNSPQVRAFFGYQMRCHIERLPDIHGDRQSAGERQCGPDAVNFKSREGI